MTISASTENYPGVTSTGTGGLSGNPGSGLWWSLGAQQTAPGPNLSYWQAENGLYLNTTFAPTSALNTSDIYDANIVNTAIDLDGQTALPNEVDGTTFLTTNSSANSATNPYTTGVTSRLFLTANADYPQGAYGLQGLTYALGTGNLQLVTGLLGFAAVDDNAVMPPSSELSGVQGGVWIGGGTSTPTIDLAAGYVQQAGEIASAATVRVLAGMYFEGNKNYGGTLTEDDDILIAAREAAGAVNNYAIHSLNAAPSSFAGDLDTAGAVNAGILSLASNTTNPTLLTQRFNLLGAPLAPGSVTAFAWQVPTATNTSAGILHVGAESSNVSQLSVSLIGIADLSATGTPSSTTFLRGDNTWATPSATGVTSIATTSPITGGTITSTGTIACATCVVASSPGAGVAHFAGSTQTVTSSLIVAADITNATITGTQIASSVALAGSPTTTTQTAGDDSTKIATTAYTNTQYTLIKTSGSPFTMTAITGFYWADSGSNYSWDLPTPQAGLQLCFGQGLDVSAAISLIPGSGVTIIYLGAPGTAGSSTGLVSDGNGEDFICLVGYNSTNYYAIGTGVGTWVNH